MIIILYTCVRMFEGSLGLFYISSRWETAVNNPSIIAISKLYDLCLLLLMGWGIMIIENISQTDDFNLSSNED